MDDFVDLLDARSGIVCAVGAGGKKTTLYALARRHPGRIALTTTVQNTYFPEDLPVEVVIDEPGRLAGRIGALGRTGNVAYACRGGKPGRHAGPDPADIRRLHDEFGFDATLVKADGARMRWIKSPKAGEPILPPGTTTVLVIVSARAIGEPLSDRIAHRPDRVAAVTGCEPGETFTARHLGILLASDRGLLRGTGNATAVAVINMVDKPERRGVAEDAARTALASTNRFERVILASMRDEATPIRAVIER